MLASEVGSKQNFTAPPSLLLKNLLLWWKVDCPPESEVFEQQRRRCCRILFAPNLRSQQVRQQQQLLRSLHPAASRRPVVMAEIAQPAQQSQQPVQHFQQPPRLRQIPKGLAAGKVTSTSTSNADITTTKQQIKSVHAQKIMQQFTLVPKTQASHPASTCYIRSPLEISTNTQERRASCPTHTSHSSMMSKTAVSFSPGKLAM